MFSRILSPSFAFIHAVCIRLSDKLLVYSVACVFEMVSTPAFNVSVFVWSFPDAVPIFICLSTASISCKLSRVCVISLPYLLRNVLNLSCL